MCCAFGSTRTSNSLHILKDDMEITYEEHIKKLKESQNQAIAALNKDHEERIAREKEKYELMAREVCSTDILTFQLSYTHKHAHKHTPHISYTKSRTSCRLYCGSIRVRYMSFGGMDSS